MRTRSEISRWLDRWQPSESIIMGGAAIIVGLASGAGVWVFKWLIELFHQVAFDRLGSAVAPLGAWTAILIPALGGLLVGLLVYFLIGEERHHGVAGIMEAVALAGGRLRYQRMPAKSVAAALSIGVGASVGPEDPSVQIGANIGSFFGQKLRLSDERIRALVAAGVASGIAAAFNAPIAGVFFALEIVLGEISGSALGIVVLSSVISAVFTQATTGRDPAFDVPQHAFGSAWELPLYLGLGLLAGPVAALYVRLLYWFQDLFQRLASVPRWLRPALAGLVVGIVGLWVPQVFGVGYETIERILNGAYFGLPLLMILMVAKALLTPVSIGGGFQGGVFAPSLYIGAMLGGAFGSLASGLFPQLDISPAAYAMVGMAAVLAAAVHAPLTAILLFFEMTNDYHIILPVMFSVVVGLLISQWLQRDSVYTLGLARKGIRLERGRDVEVLEMLTVGEIMQPSTDVLYESDTLVKAEKTFTKTRHHGFPVLDNAGNLVGIMTLQDLDRIRRVDRTQHTVGQYCTRALLVAYPEESIGTVLRKMGTRDIGRLPVVAKEDPTRLIGILSRSDLVRAYNVALSRRAAMRHRAHQVRLDATTHMDVLVEEIVIEAGAPCEGKHVSEIKWPRDCLLSSLRRERIVFIPHGDTLIRSGDVLVAVVEGTEARQELQRLCQRAEPTAQI